MATALGVDSSETVIGDEIVTIKVDYEPNSADPARVFRAMSGLIDAIHQIDVHLARSINASVEPRLLLQRIETGSLRSVMRQVVRIVDPSDMADDAVEPRVIRYLSRGAVRILAFINGHDTVENPEEVHELQQDLVLLAEETGASAFPAYEPVVAARLLEDMQRIGEAAKNLHAGDRASFTSSEGTVQINRGFGLTDRRIEDLLTSQVIQQTPLRILVVKKPDYLGASMWQFRHANHNIEAKMLDAEWLADFQARRIELRPGDAIRAEVREEIKLDAHGNLVAEHYDVLRVLSVIPVDQFTQGNLLEDIDGE